jgi:hypothetical protein
MKKLLFATLSLVLFAGTVFFSSCSKSEDNTPTDQNPVINFVAKSGYVSGDVTLTAGAAFKVNITAFSNTSSGSKLAELIISRVYNNNPKTILDSTISLSSLNAEFQANALSLVGTERWIFKVVDKAGYSSEISFNITTEAAAGPINTFSMKILGAQTAATGSSFASIDGTIYSLAEAKANQAKVDFMYYYGATDLATLAAPDDAHAAQIFTNATNGLQTWTTKNATRFKLVSDVINWDAITDDEVIVAQCASGVTESRIPGLVAGKYLAFITASGKKGMIKVESITTGDSGDITISVKVQQ